MRSLLLYLTCGLVLAHGQATAPAPAGDVNLIPNPSFEEPVAAIKDGNSIPGWKFTVPAGADPLVLNPGEATLIDDPAKAHSGRFFVRVAPKGRILFLAGPQVAKGFPAGLYDISAWIRNGNGNGGLQGGVSLGCLDVTANFLMVTDQWKKVQTLKYTKDVGIGYYPWAYMEALNVIVPDGGVVDVDDASLTMLTSGLADAFGDHMVLQRDRPVPVWGWAKNPDQPITIKFNGQTVSTTADKEGRWKVTLQPMKAGGPYVMEINGRAAAYDVMLGDVWICSGQSNMEYGIDFVHGYYNHAPDVLATMDQPQIRLWSAAKQWSNTPMHDYQVKQGDSNNTFQGIWNVCTPQTATRGVWGGFSAMGLFFGKEIQETQKVPIGLMMIANGGTQIESFISPEGLKSVPQKEWTVQPSTAEDLKRLDTMPKPPADLNAPTVAYAEAVTRYTRTLGEPQPGVDANKDFQHPYAVFNGLVSPAIPTAVRGVIWFQGEHNGGDPHYAEKLKAMIADWRTRFGDKNLPFIIGQLCNLNAPFGFEFVREGQLKVAETEPNTALAVSIDCANKEGDGNGALEIHFNDKQTVAHRMALAARALVYGEKLVSSGPIYHDMKVDGDKVRLTFTSVGGGLDAKGGKLAGFKMAGDDHKFVDADAVIDGETVVVSAAGVTKPTAVRYAYATFVSCNLYNKEGLPASPFRTDDWAPDAK